MPTTHKTARHAAGHSIAKNSLFAGSEEDGANWDALASLIETCKLHGVNPHSYFTDLLTRPVNG